MWGTFICAIEEENMSRNYKRKKSKLPGVLIILIAMLAVFSYMALYSGGVSLKKNEATAEFEDKLKDIIIKGGEFKLIQSDLDAISNLYFPEPISKGDVTVKGVNTEMVDDELLIKIPFSYSKLNLLFSCRGKVEFSDGEIVYDTYDYKIGKIPLPKDVVISQISKFDNESLHVDDNLIKIKDGVFPIKLKDLKVEDSKMVGVAEKLDMKSLLEQLE
jgi:uncharacterized protein YpmS